VPFLAYPTPLHDYSGALVGAVNMLIDITERKTAESERGYLAAIVESSDDAIISKGLDGNIRSWNRGAEAMFGYAAEEVIGRHITLLLPPDRLAEEDEIIGRLRRGERIDHLETVRRGKDGREIDVSLTISPVRDAEGRVVGASKIARDITDRKRAEQRDKLLLAELNHRVKNTLATVQSIAARSFRDGAADAYAMGAFEGRLLALSKTHDLLTKGWWEGAMLRDLVHNELSPYGGEGARFSVEGPDLRLEPDAALALGMAFHELATNAAKYGAFAKPSGKVRVVWEVAAASERRLQLRWTESGGPPVEEPGRQGFGSQLIGRGLAHQLDGEVQLHYESSGVVYTLDFRI
jgi:PAS domain S-box-containing protein